MNGNDCAKTFDGICMDDGAQQTCAGMEAYRNYCQYSNSPMDLVPRNELYILGDRVQRSLGSTIVRYPIDTHGNYLEYITDVLDVDIPLLFGLVMI